jgi:hypothetical protein
MSADPPDRSPWWRVVEEHLEQWDETHHEDLSDPWADHDDQAATLTEAQRALLLGDHDQPAPPRFTSGADDDQPGLTRLIGNDADTEREATADDGAPD